MASVDEKAYDDQYALLEKIVRDSIQTLLVEAKKNNYFNKPYGRAPFVTPLITEEQFLLSQQGGDDSEKIDPEFIFNYGFDPLRLVAERIAWAHPKSQEKRRKAKEDAQKRLHFRAEHAKKQLYVAESLVKLCNKYRSGIKWGPIFGPASTSSYPTSSSMVIAARPLRHGTVIFQLSEDESFSVIIRTIEVEVAGDYFSPYPMVAKATISDLSSDQVYFVRACLRTCSDKDRLISSEEEKQERLNGATEVVFASLDPFNSRSLESLDQTKNELTTVIESEVDWMEFPGIEAKQFSICSFRTMPKEDMFNDDNGTNNDDPQSGSNDNAQNNSNGDAATENGSVSSAIIYSPVTLQCVTGVDFGRTSVGAGTTVIIGDIFSHDLATYNEESEIDTRHRCSWQLDKKFQSSSSNNENSPSLLLAWKDDYPTAKDSLIREESTFKKHRYDLKKYQKKYATTPGKKPVANIPQPPTRRAIGVLPTFETIIQDFPIDLAYPGSVALPLEDLACRMLFRTVMLGIDVQLFILDVRKDYLGKEQATWLSNSLQQSETLWKIILVGSATSQVAVEQVEELIVKSASVESISSVQGSLSHSKELANEIDDQTGHLKGSLSHVLASFQSKMGVLKPSQTLSDEKDPATGIDVISVVSGVVIVSAGSCLMPLTGIETGDTINCPSFVSKIKNVANPNLPTSMSMEGIPSNTCMMAEVCLGSDTELVPVVFDEKYTTQAGFTSELIYSQINCYEDKENTTQFHPVQAKISLRTDGLLHIQLVGKSNIGNVGQSENDNIVFESLFKTVDISSNQINITAGEFDDEDGNTLQSEVI
eukprot:gene6431-8849_t